VAHAGGGGGRQRCIHWQKGSGYSVHVSWAGLTVSTPGTPSLAQALDWQIALAAAQGAAQARLRVARARAPRGLPPDPLTESELGAALEAEPRLRPTFAVALGRPGAGSKGSLLRTPGVQSLALAMVFRRRLAALLEARAPEAALRRERDRSVLESNRDRRDRKAAEKRLTNAVLKEMQRRSSARADKRGIEDMEYPVKGAGPPRARLPAGPCRARRGGAPDVAGHGGGALLGPGAPPPGHIARPGAQKRLREAPARADPATSPPATTARRRSWPPPVDSAVAAAPQAAATPPKMCKAPAARAPREQRSAKAKQQATPAGRCRARGPSGPPRLEA